MRARATVIALLVSLATAGGCARPAGLDVRYPESGANRALLASVQSRRVELRPVNDRRIDPSRIGAKAEAGTPLTTSRPVTEIVREALLVELAKNGHAVVGEPRDLVLATDVEEFWLDVVRAHASTQYVGKVVFALTALDGRTGDRLAVRRYVGIKRRLVDKDSDDVIREVMEAALARSVRDLATDPALVAAFARVAAAR